MYVIKPLVENNKDSNKLSEWKISSGLPSRMNVLLSYPRSGNHLCRFFIELLSERPTFGCIDNLADREIYKNTFSESVPFNITTYYEVECYYKYHYPPYTAPSVNSLILIVRSPKEVLLRQHSYQLVYKGRWDCFESYFKNIDYFNNFKGNKLLLFYEDMLTDKIGFIRKLYDFMSFKKESKLKFVIDNIDKLFGISLEANYSGWDGNTSNNQLNYYYRNIPPRIKNEFDRYIAYQLRKYPILQRFR